MAAHAGLTTNARPQMSAHYRSELSPIYFEFVRKVTGWITPCRSRRPTWPDHPARRDYIIRCEGLDIGRVYLTKLPSGDRFVWSIYLNGHVPQVSGVPISGQAVTLDKATAKLKQSYGRMRAKAGLPKPQRVMGIGDGYRGR